ncbi:thiol reductant ABC exporter subunit CydD, partial [Halomonas sp. 707D4]|nr:thiol reductant ABC exporter subunit CydD [Halomonas sp. 707D4]
MRGDTSNPAPTTPRQFLAELARTQRKRLAGAAVCGVLAGASTTALLVGVAWLVDRLIVQGQSLGSLSGVFLLLVALVVLRAGLQWGQEVLGFEASLRIRQRVRRQLLDQLAALGPL